LLTGVMGSDAAFPGGDDVGCVGETFGEKLDDNPAPPAGVGAKFGDPYRGIGVAPAAGGATIVAGAVTGGAP
jgi:hypothetical protein